MKTELTYAWDFAFIYRKEECTSVQFLWLSLCLNVWKSIPIHLISKQVHRVRTNITGLLKVGRQSVHF